MSKSKEESHKQDPAADAGDEGILWIGMDLGTSRTAVASSNGVRENTFSLVGYPRDVVSRKLLGDGPLFGADVVKHRLSLNVFRPLEGGVIKGSDDGKEAEPNMRAAHDLVRTKPNATREEIRGHIAGNYCRCTGYHAIVDAVEDALARQGVKK